MRPIKVLYLEDEPTLAKVVSESLLKHGFDVKHIQNGIDAIERFGAFEPDILVLDVMVPHKDGFQVGREVRAINPSIPIIYLTAKSQTEDLFQGFKAGGNDYIKKPFSLEELIVRIENLVKLFGNKNLDAHSKQITIGGFSFSVNKQELVMNDYIKKISYRECQLLMMLINKPAEIVSRKHILDTIWGDDHYFNSRTLDVYISKLRTYFKQDPNIELITLKSVGYRLIF